MSVKKFVNIPVFIPEKACPHQCIFCNQRHISGQQYIPTPKDVTSIIEQHLATIQSGTRVQVAFFGGSFTGIPIQEQELYLKVVAPYLQQGKVQGIRISTRPDYINDEVLHLLKKYGVVAIELGAQSFDDEVLRLSARGHTANDITIAAEHIKAFNFELGLQMMIGLPGDTPEKSLYTAKKIIETGADTTRIYPALVVKDTPLEQLFKEGKYNPLTLDEAVTQSKDIYKLFLQSHINVLRIGLHANNDFNSGETLIAGPYHASFKELVLSEIWYDLITDAIPVTPGKLELKVPLNAINHAAGYKSCNKDRLLKKYGWIKIIPDKSLHNYEFTYSYN